MSALAMLSVFSLRTSYLFVLLPVRRFGGLLGLVAAAQPPVARSLAATWRSGAGDTVNAAEHVLAETS